MSVAPPDLESLAERFRYFSETSARGYCRFYEELSLEVARDPTVLRIASHVQPGQPPVNMLFAAAQYLCMQGSQHALAGEFERAIAARGEASGDGAWEAFRSFCLEYRAAMEELVATRRTQTNEVGRSAILYPALAQASAQVEGAPLALIDIGTSAGLNLYCERFHYRYRNSERVELERGDPAAAVRLECEVRGATPPVPEAWPAIALRVGIDRYPVDVTDADQALWLRALMWPDRMERYERLQAAIDLARIDPPELVAGNAADVLPAVLERVAEDLVPCLTHCLALYQFAPEEREALESVLLETSRARTILRFSMEEAAAGNCELELFTYRAGQRSRSHLGLAHGHGRWVEWRA